jgi:hypothetical protein
MPGGGDDPDPHDRADVDDVPVANRHPMEGHLIGRVDVVGGPGRPRQSQPAGHVVVVQVRLENVGDPDPACSRQGQYTVDIALRVDDHSHLPVVYQIAAVAEGRGVDGLDL